MIIPIITNYSSIGEAAWQYIEWYKKCITTASSTVLLGITRAYT